MFRFFRNSNIQGKNICRYFCLINFLIVPVVSLSGETFPENFREADVREAALAGDVQAQLLLGTYYFNKNDGSKSSDKERACHWFRQAAKAEHPEGYYNLAVCLEHGYGTAVNKEEALELYRKAGDAGLLPARVQWALLLLKTSDSENTEAEAMTELNKLAGLSYPPAMNTLGEIILQQSRDATLTKEQAAELREQAEKYFAEAAETGYVPACRNAARQLLTSQSRTQSANERAQQARRFLQKAADQNDSEAIAQLAFCVENGIGSENSGDLAEARKLYRQAADMGHTGALLRMGEFILAGNEEELPDPEMAFQYFTKAAASGNPAAAFRVGICLAEGVGTEKDPAAAADRFLIAARANIPEAQFNLACLFLKGDDIPKDENAAFYWFKRAAENGDNRACRQAAYCCFYGIGTQKNETEGIKWLMKAADNGDHEAQKLLNGE